MKNMTDFRKTVETGMDPLLKTVCNTTRQVTYDKHLKNMQKSYENLMRQKHMKQA